MEVAAAYNALFSASASATTHMISIDPKVHGYRLLSTSASSFKNKHDLGYITNKQLHPTNWAYASHNGTTYHHSFPAQAQHSSSMIIPNNTGHAMASFTLDDAFIQAITSTRRSPYNVLDRQPHPYLFINDDDGSASLIKSYMKHIEFVNSGIENRTNFIPFIVDNIEVGYIHPSFLEHLVMFPNVFSIMMDTSIHHDISSNTKSNGQTFKVVHHINGISSPKGLYVTLHGDLRSQEERTKVINQALCILENKGIIEGWRNELYPVVDTFGNQPLFSLERAAVPYFGLKAYAIHINGFVEKENGEKYLWVARRSMKKQTFPGMFDHIVAGGQPEGISCKENVIKECDEEASIPRIISESAKAVGAVSYECIDGARFDRFTLFCYDLKLPSNFTPKNRDGEVESFSLVPISKVAKILQTAIGLYKPDCALVIIDFLIRHGYISSDEIGYLELIQSLRKGNCT